jgi:hypothetical protein
VDDRFDDEGRAIVRRAADAFAGLTDDRVKFGVAFDLNADTFEQIIDSKAPVVLAVQEGSRIVAFLDQELGGPDREPTAATVRTEDGKVSVFLIVGRISEAQFESVLMHELGHVIGLPDLPTSSDVMSGAHHEGDVLPTRFTFADVALCRAARYCP